MGWNAGYTIFEATVVGAYDLGKLDKELLAVLMEPYRGTDLDYGGEMGLKSKDGKTVVDIVIEVFGQPMPTRPDRLWRDTPEWKRYMENRWDAFQQVTNHFGWE